MIDTAPEPVESSDAKVDGPSRRRIPWSAIGLTLAGSTAFVWLAAIVISFWGPQRDGDYIADRSFFDTARPICEAAQRDVADLPNATETPEAAERMAAIQASTDRLTLMVEDLRTEVPNTAVNQPVTVWLKHWDIHLSDRRDFIDRVQKFGTEERFLETTLLKTQISKSIDRFAEVNSIPGCETPTDV